MATETDQNMVFKIVLNEPIQAKEKFCVPVNLPAVMKRKRKIRKKHPKKIENKETPGQAEAREWAVFIGKLNAAIRTMKPKIDDASPILPLANLYNKTEMQIMESMGRELDQEWRNLLKRLNVIDRTHGKTGTLEIDISIKAADLGGMKDRLLEYEQENVHLAGKLRNARTRMETVQEYATRWVKIEKDIAAGAKWPLFWRKVKKRKERVEVGPPRPYIRPHVTEHSVKYKDRRPRVEFEISITGTGIIGRFVAMLYSDYVPKTVKNFLAYCNPNAEQTYKNNRFYLIFEDYFCHTGDVVENGGYGATSIYGPHFPNEDNTLRHGERGLLTTYQKKPNRNNCHFLITFRPLQTLNGQNVVFGKVVKGMNTIDSIESIGSKKTGRPKFDVYISDIREI